MKLFLLPLLFLLTIGCAIAQTPAPPVSQTASSLGVLRHNHVALQVRDIPVSAAFYRDIIGLTPVPVPDNLKASRAWFDIGNGQMIHLLDGRTGAVLDDRNGRHTALFVRSIGQAEAFLTQKNLPYHRQVRFDGVVQLYLADPDGHQIELNEGK